MTSTINVVYNTILSFWDNNMHKVYNTYIFKHERWFMKWISSPNRNRLLIQTLKWKPIQKWIWQRWFNLEDDKYQQHSFSSHIWNIFSGSNKICKDWNTGNYFVKKKKKKRKKKERKKKERKKKAIIVMIIFVVHFNVRYKAHIFW